MLVRDAFRELSHGPLVNLAIGNEGAGTIQDGKEGRIISLLNSGLRDLYNRFTIRQRELIIEIIEGRTRYPLDSKYAESQCNPDPNADIYIKDRSDPFCDDLIKVLVVTGLNGKELPLNNEDAIYSVFTPAPTLLQVPIGCPTSHLSLTYRAGPLELKQGVFNADFYLPEVLYTALWDYVGWKIYAGMNGQDNLVVASAHKAAYDEQCATIKAEDLLNESQSNSGCKFSQRGFV